VIEQNRPPTSFLIRQVAREVPGIPPTWPHDVIGLAREAIRKLEIPPSAQLMRIYISSCTFNRMFSSLLFIFSDKAYLFELLSVRCVRHRSARVPFPFLRRVDVDCERWMQSEFCSQRNSTIQIQFTIQNFLRLVIGRIWACPITSSTSRSTPRLHSLVKKL